MGRAKHQSPNSVGAFCRDTGLLSVCEICGSLDDITLHHVLPQEISYYMENASLFRKTSRKSILCKSHHEAYELRAVELKMELCEKINIPFGTSKVITNPKSKARRDAYALINFGDKLSTTKKLMKLERIGEIIGKSVKDITTEDLQRSTEIQKQVPNKDYVNYGKMIAERMDAEELYIMWHDHFEKHYEILLLEHTQETAPVTPNIITDKDVLDCLRFYADGGIYGRNQIEIDGKCVEKPSRIDCDAGRKARKLLETLENHGSINNKIHKVHLG